MPGALKLTSHWHWRNTMTVFLISYKGQCQFKVSNKDKGENGKEKGGYPALWGFLRDVHDMKLSFASFFS